jgi:hypothetical protein
MTADKIQGGCLCGAFRFEVERPLGEVRLCHCDLCRRANGTAFSGNARVSVEQFNVISDVTTVKEFESSPGAWKAFCSTCGSPAYSRVAWDQGGIRVRLGTLARGVDAEIMAHVWVASKASWDRITDGLPCYENGVDGPRLPPES